MALSSSRLSNYSACDSNLDDSCTSSSSRCNSLRRRLDQFGYSQHFGADSAPLIDRLLSDLIHTTDSLRKVKLNASNKENETKERDQREEAVEAYRSDNSRLTALVNQMNHQHLKAKEQFEERLKSLRAQLRKLEHENTDLKFLHNQTMEKIQRLESECSRKSDKIAELQERNMQAVVQTPGGRKAQMAYRRQRMILEGPLPASRGSGSEAQCIAPCDPYVADMLQLVEEELSNLRQKTAQLQTERDSQVEMTTILNGQVEAREAEIQRLQRELEAFGASGCGGKSVDIVTLEAKNRANERLIAQLNIQVDYLQERTRELERQLECAAAESRLAQSRSAELDMVNRELECSIKEVDCAVEKAERDKEAAIKTVDRELSCARVELDQNRRLLRDAEHERARLREATERLEMENAELRRAVQCRDVELERLSTLSACLKEDKHRLTERVNRLTSNERELILELERCQRKSGPSCPPTRPGRGKSAHGPRTTTVRCPSPSKVDNWIRELESERDYWRLKVDALEDAMRKLPSVISNDSPLQRSRSGARSQTPSRLSGGRPVSKSPTRRPLSRVDQRCSPIPFAGGSPLEKQLQCERDELARMVDRLRQQLSDLQAVKIDRPCRTTVNPCTVDAALRRMEQERDDLDKELRRVASERDALQSRLKLSSEQLISERSHNELRNEDQRAVIDSLDRDRAQMQSQMADLRVRNEELELMKSRLENDIQRMEGDLDRQRSSAQHLKLLLDEAESSVGELRTRLAAKEAALASSRENEVAQDKRLSELEECRNRLEQDIDRLRANMLELDREKDSLSHLVDEKTERISYLQDELTMANKVNTTLRESLADTQNKLGDADDTNRCRDRENRQLARQLDASLCELKECRVELDTCRRECNRMREECSAMSRENTAMSTDLAACQRERDDLKRQTQDYCYEVQRIEDILAAKERERCDLLDQYRRACGDADSASQHANRLSDETVGLRQELEMRLQDVNRLREKVRQLENETRQATQAAQNAELSLGTCDRKRVCLEEELHQAGCERESLMKDLQAVRDLCAKLESSRDAIQRELAQKESDLSATERMAEELRTEVELLRQQVASERATAGGLERLLHSERQSQYVVETAKQNAVSDLQATCEKLRMVESKSEAQSSELITLRTRLLDCETELERFRRNLTHERFERERLAAHLRRHGISPPPGAVGPVPPPSLRGISPSRSISPSRR